MSLPALKKLENQLENEESILISSITNARRYSDPYQHWILSELFSLETLTELCTLPYITQHLKYNVGTREENNSFRHYFDLESQKKHSVTRRVVDLFHSPEVLDTFTDLCGVEFKGHFLRIEYAQDQEGFWLKPHTDIGVKIFTMLLYLNSEPEANMWGTDVYKDADHHNKRVPFTGNTALVFAPSTNTWHGFEPREMTGVRKTLIVNYVTEEWRNRYELASAKPI